MRQELPTLDRIVSAQSRLNPARIGVRDLERELTFERWNDRSCRLANALLGLGLRKGGRGHNHRCRLEELTPLHRPSHSRSLYSARDGP